MIMNKAGTDINPRDKYGWTPLRAAAMGGHSQICSLIKDKIQENAAAQSDAEESSEEEESNESESGEESNEESGSSTSNSDDSD